MERRTTRILLPFLFVLMGMVFSVQAQISRPGTPVSIEKNAPAVTVTETFNPAVDWNVIQQEDAFYKQQGGYAPRGGLSVPVGRRINDFGEWLLMPNGDMVWRVQLHSDSAKALGVVFSDFYMPDNAELYVYDITKQMIAGAFTSENNHSSMLFSTRLLPTSTIIIEYIEKGAGNHLIDRIPDAGFNEVTLRTEGVPVTNYQPQTNFRIDELIYMYTDVYTYFDQNRPNTGGSQACQIDIVCTPVGDNYTDQKRGVAHMVFREGGSWYYCSGTLVNNTLQNGVPYFLTAYHCGGIASAADHNVWQFYFNYERPNCGSGTPPTSDMMTGCVKRAGYPILNGSDFQLVELNSNVPLSYSPFYNGWDRSTVGATSGASIHHPAGDVKKISTFTAQLTSSTPNIGGEVMATNSAWRVVWSSNPNGWGVTEGGSSGSPIFNQNGLQVGTLTGGSSTCASPTSADFYGKFDYHWISNGGTSDVQLRPWLDPAGTDPQTLNGWDPTWVSAPPVCDFVADQTNIVAGTTVQFTDLSTNGPTSWSWTITGAYPETSTVRNPQFTFINPGQYTVTLTSSNSYGPDTETKVNYITVSPFVNPTVNPVTIGTGTNSGTYWPLGISTQGTADYRYVADASIYTAAQMQTSGIIERIEWNPSTSRTDSRNIEIYMKQTTANAFTSSTVASHLTGATLVYSGPFVPNVAGWFAFDLETPFAYSNTSNLMVIVKTNTSGSPGNRPSNCYYTTAPANRHQQWNGASDPTGSGTVNANLPNVRFTFQTATAPVADFTLPNTIYFEGFEEATTDGSLPAGWTQKRTTNLNDNPVTDAVAPMWFNNSANYGFAAWQDYVHTGVGSMATGYTAPDFTWAISPDIVLPNTTGLELRYWTWWFSDATYQTNYYVKVYADGVWTTIQSNLGSAANTNEYVSEVVLSLAAYQNKTIKIAFVYDYTDGYQMAIDDILIVDDAVPTHVTLYEGESTTFFDASTNNPIVWSWQLPGGTPTTSNEQNPTIQYNVAGWYDVSLTAANAAGSDIETKNNYVEVLGRAPLANFGATGNLKTIFFQPFIPSGADVVFTDMSTRVPTGWNWTFENGNPASSTSPIQTVNYTATGEHDVQLIATNAHGNDTLSIDSLVAVMGTFFVTNMMPSDGLTVYTLGTTEGYLPGHNGYLMNKYAEFFTNSYEGEITAVLFGVYEALGTGKNINVTIWESNNGAPGAILHTQTEAITNFTALQYNVITLTAPVTVTGDFFVGYELNYDATHNYTTHMFCPMMAPARSGVNPPNSAWVMDQSVWYTIDDLFGGLPTALSVEPEFTYASTGPIATVTATPGCGTGTVRVTSSENTNQTFHLTDNVGTILNSWTGNAQFYDFTGLASGTYRGQVVVGAQTSPLSAAVVLTNDPTSVGGAVSGINPQLCLGSNTGTLTLAGHTGTVLRWQKRINAGGWTDIANTATTYSEVPASAGTWEYRAEVQSGSCPAAFSSAYSILVHPATVAGSVSGVNPAICLGQSTGTLTLSGYTGTINKWQVRYNAGAWTDIAHTGATYSTTPGAAGTYEYRAEVQSGTCAAAFSTAYTITVSPLSVGGSVTGTNTQICLGSATGTMTLAGHTGTITKWQVSFNAGPWTDIANTTTTYSTTPGAAGTYQYRAVVQSGVCSEAFSAAHSITVHPVSVGGSVTGATTEICLGLSTGTMTLSGHTGTIVRWQKRVNAGAWTNITNTTTTYSETPSSAGTWEYRAEIQSGNCISTFSTAHSIVVHPTTVGGSVTSATTQICLGSPTGTMTLSGHTGTIVRWERRYNAGAWQNIANTTTTHSETPAAAGTYEYRAVVQSGTCATANSAIHTITVHPVSVGGNVTGGTAEICLGLSTGTMTLSGHTGTIVRWQKRLNFGAWTNIANTTTTYSETPSSAGTWDYRAEVQSGNCTSTFSTPHTIVVHPASVGGSVTGATTQLCLGGSTGTMTLSGHTGTITKWQRSIDGGAWTDIANTTTTHSETPATAGSYQYRAVVKSGTCSETYSAAHTITVYPVSVGGSVTGVATQICLGENTGTLTLAGHTGTVVRWQKRVDGGAWTNITNTLTTYSEIPSSTGVWDYRAEVQSGNCTSTYSAIKTITVNPGSVGGNVTGTNSEICLGVETGLMTLSGYTGSIVRWQKRVDAGAWTDIVNTASTYNETPATAGVWEYRAVVQSGTCTEAYSTAHAITVHPVSVGGSVSGTNTELCLGSNTGTLTLSGYTGSIVRWQKRVDGGAWTDIVNTAATYSEIPSSAGVWEYRAEVKSGSCNSVFSAAYSITVYPATVAGSVTGTITEACLGAGTGTLTLSGYVGTIVKWQRQVNGGGWTDIANTAATYSETPATSGVYEYRAVVKSGVCSEGFSTAHTITFYPVTVGGSVAGINPEICLGANTGTLTLSGHTGSVVRWQKRLNAGGWTNIANTGTTYSEVPSSAGVWEYRVEIKSGACNTEYSTAYSVTVHPASVGGSVTGTITEACLGSGTGTLTLSGYVGSIVKWQRSVDGGAWTDIANTAATYSETPVTAGVYAYRAVLQSGTCSEAYSVAHTITFYPVSVGGTVTGTLTEICLGSNTGLMTLAGYTGTIIRWQKRVDGGAWNNIANTINMFGEIPTSAGVWEYRAEVQSGICSSVFSSAWTVTVNPATVAGTLSIPQTQYCIGSPTSIMTLSGYTGVIVKWQKRLDGGAWTDIAHTGNTYSETPPSAGVWDYQVVVQSGSCAQATSNMVSLTVAPATIGGTTSTGITQIFIGQSTDNITLAGHTGTVVKWQKRLDGGAWTDIAFTGTVYSETPNAVGFWDYRAVVQSGVCAQEFSAFVTVEVLPSQAGGVTGGNSPICLGDNTGIMTLSGYSGSIVRWEKRVDAGAWTPIAHTLDTYSEIPTSAGTWEYRGVVFTTVELFSAPATIVVNPLTVGGSVTGNSQICLGSSTGTLTLAGHTGSVLKWQVRYNAGAWTDIVNTSTTYSEIPAVAGNYEYRAQVQSGVCASAFSAAQLVVVHPVTVGGSVSGPNSEICVGSSTGTLTLTGYTGTIVRWERSDNMGSTWMNLGNTAPTYSEIPGVPGVRMYRAVVQSGSCSEVNSSSHTIVIYPLSAGGTITGPNTQICLGSSTGTMTLSGYTGAIQKWQVSYNAGPWTDIANTNATYSTTPGLAGTYSYRAVVQSGVCGSANSTEFSITVDPLVAGGTLDNNGSTICLGSPIPTLTLTGYTGSIVKWQKSDDGVTWTDIVNTNATYSETPATSGDWYYRVEVSSGTCGSAYSTISVIHVDPVSAGGAVNGPNTQICLGSSTGTMTLTGHTGSITKWQVSYNAGPWTDIVNTNATYSTVPASSGTYSYRAVVQSGSCSEAYSAAFTITVDPVTVGGAVSGPNTQICLGSSTGTMTLSGHTGTIIKWQVSYNAGAWTDITNTAATYSTTPVAAGTYAYRAVIQSGSCSVVNSASFTITVNPIVVGGAVNGTLTETCLGSSVGSLTLSGHTGTVVKWQKQLNAGAWTDIAFTGTSYTETPVIAGVWNYRAVVESGACGQANSAAFAVTVHPATVAGNVTGVETEICLGSSTGTLTLGGYTGTILKWQRSIDGGAWTDIAHTGATYSETPLVAGVYAYRAQVQSGTCSALFSASHTITVYPVTVAGGVTPVLTTIFLGEQTGTLTLSGHTGTVVKWQKRHDGGAWVDIVNTATTYIETPALVGTWEYRAVIESGVCGQEFSAVATVIVQASAAGSVSGGNSPICLGSSTGIMTLSGYTGTILRWQKSLDGGAWTDIAHTLDTYSEIPSSAGTWQYRAVVFTTIELFSNPVTIVVDPVTIPGTLNGGGAICLGTLTPLMTLSGYTGDILNWEVRYNGGVWTNIVNTANSYSEIPALAGLYEYRVLVQSGVCGSDYSNIVSVTVDPTVAGGTLDNNGQTICFGSQTPLYTLTGYSGTIVKWQKSDDGVNWTDIVNTGNTYQEIPSSAGNWYYRAVIESGACGSVNSTVSSVTVDPATFVGTLSGVNTEICLGNPTGTMTLSGNTGSVVKWQYNIDGGAWNDIVHTSTTYNETPLTSGLYGYRVEVQSGVCAAEYSDVHYINVFPLVVAGAVNSDATICEGSSTGVLTLTGYTGTVVKWQKSDDGVNWTDISNTTDTYSEVPATTGTWYYRAEVQSGVCGSEFSGAAVITVDPATVTGTLTALTTEICEGSATGLMSLTGYTGNVIQWIARVDGGAWTDIAVTTDTYEDTPASTGVWEYAVVVQSGVCDADTSNLVMISVIEGTVAGTLDAPYTEICENTSTGTMTVTGYTGNIIKWQKRLNMGTWIDIANTTDTHSEVLITPGSWSFRAEVQNGSCDILYTNVVTIEVSSATVAGVIEGNEAEICLGETTGLMVINGFTGSIQMWQRRVDGGAWEDLAVTVSTYEDTPLLSGVWEYRALVQSGSCAQEYTDTATVTVYDMPVAGFTYVVDNYTVTFTNTSTGATSYYWTFGDGNNSTDVNPVHTYATSGSKVVTLTAYNGVCEDQYQITISITVSIIEFGDNASIGIYPNPTDNGRFNISFMTDESEEYEISIYDVTGRIIYSEIVTGITNGTVHPVVLTDTAPGAYRIRLTAEDGSYEKVLIIQ